jgi:hypothetical protein
MNAKKSTLVVLIVLFCVCACSASLKMKTSTWMNSMYSSQYDEYMTWFHKDSDGKYVTRRGVTEEQKEILREKKRLLTELHPLLTAYAVYASGMDAPEGFDMTVVEERAIFLINELMRLSMQHKDGG